jgi:hypothetical protein
MKKPQVLLAAKLLREAGLNVNKDENVLAYSCLSIDFYNKIVKKIKAIPVTGRGGP